MPSYLIGPQLDNGAVSCLCVFNVCSKVNFQTRKEQVSAEYVDFVRLAHFNKPHSMVFQSTRIPRECSFGWETFRHRGYLRFRGSIAGREFLRLQKVTSFSVHDIILVDTPASHLVLDTVEDCEVYNVAIRGGNEGGLDGIDITYCERLGP